MSWATELLGETVLVHDGPGVTSSRPVAEIIERKKYIALYFSAHWCPPCRGFTPIFADLYKQQSGSKKDVEVIFISSDNDAAAFKAYFGTHPWTALPYADRTRAQRLMSKFGVRGIPSVVVLSAVDGHVVTKDGRNAIAAANSLDDLFDGTAAADDSTNEGGCVVA